MATQADLRTRILDDLARPSSSTWTTRVNNAIADAIAFYQPKRFWFTKTRTATFTTTAAKSLYTFLVADSSITADIQYEMYKIERVLITIGNQPQDLVEYDYTELEYLIEANATQGQPYAYAYINRALQLYAIPNATYTVTMLGDFRQGAPPNDTATGNVWMNEGFELIRSRAKLQLAMHVLEDAGLAQRMTSMEQSALSNLRQAGAKKQAHASNLIPTQW